jgi:NitT/TauT family transport system substrate-binding protein
MTGWTRRAFAATAAAAAGLALAPRPVRAAVPEIRLAQQASLAHLPLMIMQHEGLLERQLASRGLGQTRVSWMSLAGSSAMIDGMLSGSLQVASTGTSGFAILWDRTRGKIKAIASQCETPTLLVARNPAIRSLDEMPEGAKIALPAVGTSPQAIILKLAALKKYGPADIGHYDRLTVTMAHPDAYAAMLSGASGIEAHFAAPPYTRWELDRIPGAHVLLASDDVTGGPVSTTVAMAGEDFRKENPQGFASVNAALREAIDFINASPEPAARIYLDVVGDGSDMLADTVAQITDPRMKFDYTPSRMLPYLKGMHDIGMVGRQPSDWRELFFEEAHDLAGS